MEQDERETSGVTRNTNVVLTVPHDWSAIDTFLAPALDRADATAAETQLLIVTPDAETAAAVAESAERLAGDERRVRVVPATSARRAMRLLRARPAIAVAGTPADLAELLGASALKLEGLRAIVLAWADVILASDESGPALEALMAEVPKEAARTLVVARPSDAADAFVERYMRRARRVGEAPSVEAGRPVAVQYVSVPPAARPAALRRLLDELDPPSVAVIARTPAAADDARRALRTLGYADDDADVRVITGEDTPDASLVILYDVPSTPGELRAAASGGATALIALLQPRQLAHLREIAQGPVTPLAMGGAVAQARARDEALRRELREQLVQGTPIRELLALEPLLAEHDGAEVAAAALRLLERERERAAQIAAAGVAVTRGTGAPASAAPASSGAWTRLYINVGDRDGIRPGDLVGAISGEAGITSDNIGKIELRDTHALVEIATPVAATVAEKISGISIKGRRVQARVDQESGQRDTRTGRGERGDRGAARGPRRDAGDRPSRGPARGPARGRDDRGPRAPRGDRPERGARPVRGDRGERGDRPPRGDSPARGGGRGAKDFSVGRMSGERVSREGLPAGDDWSERAERLRRAKRTPMDVAENPRDEAPGE